MVYVNRTKTPPESLAAEKLKKDGDWNQPDVKELLYKDFRNKCYICEETPLQDGGVAEHLVSHKGNDDLKFDWENLFLSCGHCNGIKNRTEYEKGIIDCTKTDPSTFIRHKLEEKAVKIDVLDESSESAKKTAKLIEECFNGVSTVTRKAAATVRITDLKNEMSKFLKVFNKYKDERKPYHKKQLVAMLEPSTRFAAFKIDYINENPALAKLVSVES